ncbi:MAG TPA: alpha/beta fold hydrolase [Gemmatimonadaceae bacterium]|nr:alpha/beta fold hydrolase [Gemmatimonadaceae bacterium]
MPILSLPDADLAYQVDGEGPPLLLIHGLGANAATWELQVQAFAPRYRVITFDLRGTPASRDRLHPHGPFSIPQFAADTRALLDHLGVEAAHVIGLSLGGMIAFQMAVDTPHYLRSMTIVNSGPAVVPRSLVEHWAIAVRQLITRLAGPATFAKILAPKLFPRPEHAELRERFKATLGANDRRAYVATLNAILGWTVLDRIGTIEIPTLVVTGDHDYTSVASKEAYVRLMPRAKLVVVEDSRHALPMERAEAFNAVVAEFLADLER